jgi:uncharacterized RDD family membrane protein YckC
VEELRVMDQSSRPPLAAIPVRFVAILLDGIIPTTIAIPAAIVVGIVSLSLPNVPSDGMQVFAIFVALLTAVGFMAYLALVLGMWAYGLTPGKWIMGIRVVKQDTGLAAGFWRMALRQIVGQWVSAVFCYLGYVWALVDADRQCWHDKIARTLVIRTR